MNRYTLFLAAMLLFLLPTAAFASSTRRLPLNTLNATPLNGHISADTTLTHAASPYQVSNFVIVDAGATLTVEPGVTILFAQAATFVVNGNLDAQGTAAQPIVFDGVTDQANQWGGISADGTPSVPAQITLSHVVIDDGGRGGGNANLYTVDAVVNLSHATIQDSSGAGIKSVNAPVLLDDVTLTNNAAEAVRLEDIGTIPQLANVSGSGNGRNVIMLRGTLRDPLTLPKLGLDYLLYNYIEVSASGDLTVEPGVTLLVEEATGFTVAGELTAIGRSDAPITFAASNGQSGAWSGIVADGTPALPAALTLEHVVIAGGGRGGGNANLYAVDALVNLSHATVRNSGGDGIKSINAPITLDDVTLTNNIGDAVRLDDISTNPQLADVRGSGNGRDVVVIRGTVRNALTLPKLDLDYVLNNYIDVTASGDLTIEPGVTIVAENTAGFTVAGTLTGVGTESKPIQLLGSGMGAWSGIVADGTPALPAHVTLEHVVIRGGGRTGGGANLYAVDALINLSHATIEESGGVGIRSVNAPLVLNDVILTNSVGDAVRIEDISANPQLANVRGSGNGRNVVVIRGTVRAALTLPKLDLDYVLNNYIDVVAGGHLTVEPGVTMLVEETASFTVAGMLTAIGRSDAPITLTALNGLSGAWSGIVANGTPNVPAQVQLEHVTLMDGGRGGSNTNLFANGARLIVRNSIISESSGHGVVVHQPLYGSLIEMSSIVNNSGYGVRNQTQNRPILATNNYWGSINGPASDVVGCNTGGNGAAVTGGVLFLPFRTAIDSAMIEVVPPRIVLTPQQWYVSADGVSRAVIEVAAFDALGKPLANAELTMATTLGSVSPTSGRTGIDGKFLATIVSSQMGTATVNAFAGGQLCSGFLPSETQVTFTEFNAGDLLPNATAPYFNGNLSITPMPVVRGCQRRPACG